MRKEKKNVREIEAADEEGQRMRDSKEIERLRGRRMREIVIQ